MGNAGPPGAFTQDEAFHAALRQHELGGGQQRGPEIAMMIIRRLRHRPHCSTGSAPSHDSPSLALLLRHRPGPWSSAFWLSVLLGLVLTFVLGACAGVVLSAGNGH